MKNFIAKKNRESITILLLIILFISGFIFHNIDFTRPYVMSMTDFFLLLTNGLVYYFLWRKAGSFKLFLWSILAFTLTFLTEFAGVATGKVFGNYEYGSTMQIQVGEVPVVIAFNWIILILATYSLSNKLVRNRWIIPVLSSFLIVIFDFIMEPVAMYLDYWQWEGDTIPVQNYIAWFIISFIFANFLSALRIKPDSRILRYYFFIQMGFFLLFRIEMLLK